MVGWVVDSDNIVRLLNELGANVGPTSGVVGAECGVGKFCIEVMEWFLG